LAAGLKLVAGLVLLACLLEPLLSGTRATPGANVFLILADNSQSLVLRDRSATQSRGEQV